ncbi:MAG: tetratricopeptide repeat protein [Candidatus Omnitrophica bacterium]|nr:tetratricopeptide repeat protein [Candidatus Omnitrophota bacterium]
MVKNNITALAIILVMALGFAVYLNSLNGEFVFDDNVLVKENIYIKNHSRIKNLFTENIASGAGRKTSFYRPLQMITYMIDFSLWRLNVKGYHLTNILLHIAASLCLYWFITILFKERLLSLFTSVLFVTHPIHTEAVTYISGRSDMLCAIFLLLCVIFYIKSLGIDKARYHFFTLAAYILAILSRESSVILPAVLLLYHYAFKKKLDYNRFLPILGIAAFYIFLRFTFLNAIMPQVSGGDPLFERLPGFFVALTNYARLLILPIGLHMEYGKRTFSFVNPQVLSGIAIFVTLLVFAFRKKPAGGIAFFSISWFLVMLLPVSNIFPINAYMAEHWLYLPSIGFFLLLAKGLTYLFESGARKKLAILSLAALTVFYSFLTIRQNNYWSDAISFYERTLECAPDSLKAQNNLGNAYRQKGEYQKAIRCYEGVLKKDPNHGEAYYNLGLTYSALGRKDKAAELYRKAIGITPDHADSYNNLGRIYIEMGKVQDAIRLFEEAIEADPNYVGAYTNLGNIYLKIDTERSIALYKRSIEIDPYFTGAYNNLGSIYRDTGRDREAIGLFKKVITIDPTDAMAHFNLSVLYFRQKRYGLAVKHCDRIIELGETVDPKYLALLKPYRDRRG